MESPLIVPGALAVFLVFGGIWDARVTTQEAVVPVAACTTEAIQAIAPLDTTITGAAVVSASGNLPEHCRVDGHTASSGNEVNFRVALPANWNDKFIFFGVGGLGGTIGSLNAGLARGYASASTDTGHLASDPSWGANRAKEIDYGHRGTHVTTVAAKALTASYFKRLPRFSYFEGCSNGGRQAMMEVQRYPGDFDGIIAGDPATGTNMQVGRAVISQHMLASTENYLTPEKVELLSSATLNTCDATDGLRDGLISEPLKCAFKPETLQCGGGDRPDCLTSGQVETARRIYDGLRLPEGEAYTAPFPVGHEGGTTGWQAWITGRTPAERQDDGTLRFTANAPNGFELSEQNMRFLALDHDDPAFNWRTLRFPQDLPRLKTMTEILSPLDPDLTPFKARGGKLIVYHGLSLCPYPQVARYIGSGSIDDAANFRCEAPTR